MAFFEESYRLAQRLIRASDELNGMPASGRWLPDMDGCFRPLTMRATAHGDVSGCPAPTKTMSNAGQFPIKRLAKTSDSHELPIYFPRFLERPLINHIGPILQHRTTLIPVFGLVVNGAHAFLLVRKTLLDPIGIVARLVQQRAGRASQVVGTELA